MATLLMRLILLAALKIVFAKISNDTSCSFIRYELMLGCWATEPAERPAFHQIVGVLQSFVEKLSCESSSADYV